MRVASLVPMRDAGAIVRGDPLPMTGSRRPSFLFVCMGNICRSPTVEAVARVEFARMGLDVHVASAGTEDYHVGAAADPRAVASAEARGYPLSTHRARQVVRDDFTRWDHLLVMDRANEKALRAIAPSDQHGRVALFLPFAGVAAATELPDPYYGSLADFEHALDLACAGIRALARRLAGS